MKPGIWTDAFQESEPEEALERLAHIGWKHIELAEKHMHDIDKRQRPDKHILNLNKLCADLGISIVTVHAPIFNLCDEQSPRTRSEMPLMGPALKWAGVLGAEWVVVHPGTPADMWSGEATERARQQNLRAFQKFVAEAETARVGIAAENLCGRESRMGTERFGAVPGQLLWLASSLDAENVGVCWDTGHARLQGLDQYRAIKALGKHLVTTHIHDSDGVADRHLLPFDGDIDWQGVMRALREIDYTGYLVLEVGGAVHGLPLAIREAKLRYALELTEALAAGQLW